ncbi:MAG: hypothetical protein SFV17_17995 [Candidatus Obscuribacter sp.]|nr:hypothetical protein [Candidatus Melainabacteria bacterium]MDX1988582.1 hypothetical protein [Candidatus Obscuribacter sp.]
MSTHVDVDFVGAKSAFIEVNFLNGISVYRPILPFDIKVGNEAAGQYAFGACKETCALSDRLPQHRTI